MGHNHLLLLAIFALSLHGYSKASSCTPDEDALDEITIVNVLDKDGEWETIVTNNLDPSNAQNSTNIDVKRQLVERDGKKKMVVTVSLKGHFHGYSLGPLRFNKQGAKYIKVYKDGTAVKKIHSPDSEVIEEGYGGVLTNRPLQDDELFQVKIDELIDEYNTSLGIGISRFDPKTTEYSSWMLCGTKMLYNQKLYESGSITKREYGPNLRELNVGDKIGVMKRSNGDLVFFVNGEELGVAATGIKGRIYGVLDLYGKAVEASLA